MQRDVRCWLSSLCRKKTPQRITKYNVLNVRLCFQRRLRYSLLLTGHNFVDANFALDCAHNFANFPIEWVC